jgi:aspartyl/asparaginyl-tRNA synthetase
MIEPEISFAELSDDMALAEDYVKYCTRYALENCADDLHYFEHEFPGKLFAFILDTIDRHTRQCSSLSSMY